MIKRKEKAIIVAALMHGFAATLKSRGKGWGQSWYFLDYSLI